MTDNPAVACGYVYVLVHPDERRKGHYTKIGYSRLHPEKGGSGNNKPRKVHLDFILEAFGLGKLDMPLCEQHRAAKTIEKRLHKYFSGCRRTNVGASKEIFDVDPQVVIKQYRQEVEALG